MGKELYSAAKMAKALRECQGMVYLAAEALGCTPQTVYNYIDRHPTVKEAWETASGKVLDVGEMKLYEHVLKGEAWAVCFLLKTKGKSRGYVERTEQTGKDGGAMTHEVDVQVTSAKKDLMTRLATMAARKAQGAGTNGHGNTVSG